MVRPGVSLTELSKTRRVQKEQNRINGSAPVMAFWVELVTEPLRKKSGQMDYQRRIFAWSGHYLKDEPAPTRITNGESYLEHQRERRK